MSGPTPFKTLHTQAAEIASQEGFTDKRPVSHEGPLPLVRDIPDPDPYPVEALGPLRAAAEAAQDLTQAPIEIAAQSVLASASLGTQVIADVQTLGGTAPVSLYALTIARSGERKSSVDKILTKSIRDWERTQWARYEDEVEKWKNDHAIWKADHELAMKVFKTGKGDRTAATADLDALGPEPKPPVEPAVIVSDPTVEGIQKLLAKGKMSLGMFSDEGGQFLGGFGMSKDNRLKTISTLSSLWDGTPITRTRAGDGTKTLFGRRITMHLMVQPKVAQGLLGDGLSND
ncbi:DUF3987 domain-containing protein [Phaeobacter marinintestinus]|uniref:DUF3987 domain-containing protein n=1 Tax=Falsiphaeobacter marinintestinus TaxID=1492905 RepID=UPI0011B41E26|nr:DUF3987 domain-containing protein [Phaeobacter marinintestinus]